MERMEKKLEQTVKFLRSKTSMQPEIGVILGSGLGVFADTLTEKLGIPYKQIPNFPESTVVGHGNTLVFGKSSGKNLVVMQGRFHFYEGFSMQEITFPVRVMEKLGVKKIIVTNAGGGLNKEFKPADLMVLTDHINFMGDNPLYGIPDKVFGPRFTDMTYAYAPELVKIVEKSAQETGIVLRKGVYCAVRGPNYETPAEIRMFITVGADAVGMSTVPETIVANQIGLKVIGISCITNIGAGLTGEKLDHKEVIETSAKARDKFVKLLETTIKNLPA